MSTSDPSSTLPFMRSTSSSGPHRLRPPRKIVAGQTSPAYKRVNDPCCLERSPEKGPQYGVDTKRRTAMPHHSSLKGRTIIVTGGSRGLGREMALALVEAGARVAISARSESANLHEVLEAAEAMGGHGCILPLVGDVADAGACARMVGETVAAFGNVQCLINNAAVGTPTIVDADGQSPVPFWKAEPETWGRLIDTNVNGVFLMSRAVVPLMLSRGFGRIINLSTSNRSMDRPQNSPYGPSKAFVEAASRTWAQELEGTGITVNVLLPGGAIETAMSVAREGGRERPFLPIAIMRAPVLWLASDLSSAHSGERFVAQLWNEDLPLLERIIAAREAGAAQHRTN